MRRAVVIAAALVVPPHAWAVNKCTAPDGKVTFQDAPCDAGNAGRASGAQLGAAASSITDGPLTPERRRAMAEQMNREVTAALERREQEQEKQRRRLTSPATLTAKPVTSSTSIPFDECRNTVARLLLGYAGQVKTVTLILSDQITMHLVCTSDASVMLTCSRPDAALLTTKTAGPHPDCR